MESNLYSIITNEPKEYKVVAENIEKALEQVKKIGKNIDDIIIIRLEEKVFINQ